MGESQAQRSHTSYDNRLNLVIRLGVCLFSAAIHLSINWASLTVFDWGFAVFLGIVYPLTLHYFPLFPYSSSKNLIPDNFIYGVCIGMWGFSPFLATCYLASASIINVAAGGLRWWILGISTMIVGSLLAGLLNHWAFKENISLFTSVLATAGLCFFMTSLGIRIHNINARLRQTRNDLRSQKQELININTMALAVNSHLDVDIIIKDVVETIEHLYPFEALYILSFEEDRNLLEVSGIYGSSITEEEHAAFRQFQFDLQRDKDSIFIKGLYSKKIIYIPYITAEMVDQGAKVDRDLFTVKPSISMAYFPVFIQDKVVAGACFINYENTFELDQNDLQRIQQFLVQVGTALRNARLIKDLKESKRIAEKAQKEAEASEEAKSRFLANMSHEIRTPLTAIMGYSEALQDPDTTDEDSKEYVGHILRSGKHLLSMINDILDISKIEAHKIEIENIECDLLEALCDIDSYLCIKAQEKSLSFRMDIHYPIPRTIKSDPTRIKQILLNLCNNAVKFTEQGSITLSVSMPSAKLLKIQVIDTGIGIPEAEQQKIFNAFDQADTSITRRYGGTGLGLYISKNLAQLMGGDLSVVSCEGQGSTFTFVTTIGITQNALIESADSFTQAMKQVRESKTYAGVPSLEGSILVAEDNPENQRLVERLIRQTGLEVTLVDNGEKAVEKATKFDYCAILMDMQMPVMGGREAAAKIKNAGVETPIIAFTANVMKHQVDEYRQRGFFEVLEKPISREKLFSTLDQVVGHYRQKSIRVLIAEDNEVNQMILHRYVTKYNEKADVEWVLNGQQALEALGKSQFDLIFMDMEMPVMGGLAATKAIRESGIHTPLYMVSGNIGKDDVARSIAAGANGHVGKPIDKNTIYDIVRKCTRAH